MELVPVSRGLNLTQMLPNSRLWPDGALAAELECPRAAQLQPAELGAAPAQQTKSGRCLLGFAAALSCPAGATGEPKTQAVLTRGLFALH